MGAPWKDTSALAACSVPFTLSGWISYLAVVLYQIGAGEVDRIYSGTAVENVSHPIVRVVVLATTHDVVPGTGRYHVSSGAALDFVVAVSAVYRIVVSTADQSILSG